MLHAALLLLHASSPPQAKRLQSPAVIITNHDASNMPNLLVRDPLMICFKRMRILI